MSSGTIEIEVRGVQPHEESRGLVLVGRRGGSDPQVLALEIPRGDVHALWHELQGHETTRTQAVDLAGSIAAALGGRFVAVRLSACEPGFVKGSIEIETSGGTVGVFTQPGQALAWALRLGLPLLADDDVLPPIEKPSDPALAGPVAAFLNSLDLGGLGGAPH
jgi:bifunctional DNase/RNase